MRILAVDDDPIIREMVQAILTASGDDDVVSASSGAEALEILQGDGQGFDALLFDIQMPGMDGTELVRRTRALEEYRIVPIVMLTAMSDKGSIDEAFQAGASDYIMKPFEAAELETRLKVARMMSDGQQCIADKADAARTQWDAARSQPLRGADRHIPLAADYPVQDVDRVIPLVPFRNYLKTLGRGSLLLSSVMAFRIDGMERLYAGLTDYEYTCVVTDIAEALTTALGFPQFLLTYFGNGTYLCVAEGIDSWQLEELPMNIRHAIEDIDPCYGDGRPMMLTVQAGAPVSLRFRSGASLDQAITAAIGNVDADPIMPPRAETGAPRLRLFG